MKLGLSCLFDKEIDLIRDKRVGLVTNKSAINAAGEWTVDLFLKDGRFKLAALFAPEHGLYSNVPAGQEVEPFTKDGIPVFSLYGQNKRPTEEMLSSIEVLVFDLQDVGIRWFTYITTLGLAMEACAKKGLPIIVLDRPNPLNGLIVAGNILDPKFKSFVGYYPLPIRHGMTIGELANLFNQQINAGLEVVKMEGWKRKMWYDQTVLNWSPPSPNLGSLETALVYGGTCLLEGTNISEGRGTLMPFQLIGAPWIESAELLADLTILNLPGVSFEEASFKPASSKYSGQQCFGVTIKVAEREVVNPIEIGLNLISLISQFYPNEFKWTVGPDGKYFFDKLMGTNKVRDQIKLGVTIKEIMQSWQKGLSIFLNKRKDILLYD